MKESIKLLSEQMEYISRIFEEGKIGSVLYNSYALVHQIATDALKELTEKDATIKGMTLQLTRSNELYGHMKNAYLEQCKETGRLRKALEEAKDNIQTIYFNCESPMTVTSNCDDAIREINTALGEGEKE